MLKVLRDGPATFDAVVAGVPTEDGHSAIDKRDACVMTLRRLRLKKVVVEAGGTYMLSV